MAKLIISGPQDFSHEITVASTSWDDVQEQLTATLCEYQKCVGDAPLCAFFYEDDEGDKCILRDAANWEELLSEKVDEQGSESQSSQLQLPIELAAVDHRSDSWAWSTLKPPPGLDRPQDLPVYKTFVHFKDDATLEPKNNTC